MWCYDRPLVVSVFTSDFRTWQQGFAPIQTQEHYRCWVIVSVPVPPHLCWFCALGRCWNRNYISSGDIFHSLGHAIYFRSCGGILDASAHNDMLCNRCCDAFLPMQDVEFPLCSEVGRKGAEVNAVDGHVACLIFIKRTRLWWTCCELMNGSWSSCSDLQLKYTFLLQLITTSPHHQVITYPNRCLVIQSESWKLLYNWNYKQHIDCILRASFAVCQYSTIHHCLH